MELSSKIKAIRESKRIKLNQVAEALDIDVSNYAKIERKGNKISFDRLEEIAKILGVTVQEIINWGNETVSNDQQTTEHLVTIELLHAEIESLQNRLEAKYLSAKGLALTTFRLQANLDSIIYEVAKELSLGEPITEEEEEEYHKQKLENGVGETVIYGKLFTFEDLDKIVLRLEEKEPGLCSVLLTLFDAGLLDIDNDFAYIFTSRAYSPKITVNGLKQKRKKTKK